MGRLALALWAALVAAELAGASITRGKGQRAAAGPASAPCSLSARRSTLPPTRNLSCFQCYKVHSLSLCKPAVCPAAAQVCVSKDVFLLRKSKTRILISKRCAVSCPNSNSEFEWSSASGLRGRITRRCCSGQLCNMAPAALETLWALARWLLLQVVLGIFWALL